MHRHRWGRATSGAAVLLMAASLTGLAGASSAQATTSPACILTPSDFANALLHALPKPDTSQNVAALVGWAAREGGNWGNNAKFNPFNTAEVLDGSTSINSVGVQAYGSWDIGVAATVKTLKNGRYPGILSALAAGNNADAVAAAVGASPWGTPDFSSLIGKPYNPPPPAWQPACKSAPSVAPGAAEDALLAPNGTIAAFTINGAGNLFETNQTSASSSFKTFGQVTRSANLTGTPSAVLVPSSETIATFSDTTAGQVELVGQTSSSSAFTSVATIGSGTHPAFVGSPKAIVAPNGTVAVFALGSNGALYETNQTALGSSFKAWGKIGSGGLAAVPSAVLVPSSHTLVTFDTTTGGQVQLIGQTSSSSGFTSVATIGSGTHAAFVGSPKAIVAPNGTVAVFAMGSDGFLYETNQTALGSSFKAWGKIGRGSLTGTPSVVLVPSSHTIATFSRTTAGQIELIGQTSSSSGFTSVATVGTGSPGFVTSPVSLIAPNGTAVVFSFSGNDHHYETNQTALGSAFKAWTQMN